eukprot:scaffold111574_cov33-Attheya_sp.AAC.1
MALGERSTLVLHSRQKNNNNDVRIRLSWRGQWDLVALTSRLEALVFHVRTESTQMSPYLVVAISGARAGFRPDQSYVTSSIIDRNLAALHRF